MDRDIPISDLSKPEQLQTLKGALSEMSEELDILYSTTAPNGSILARQGRLCLYNNSGTYSLWLNTTGSTVWVEITNQTDFVAGDLIVSTVTTAHSDWTDVSATYADKFMRINATPLSTGGADTHTHAAGSLAGPSHTHTVPYTGYGIVGSYSDGGTIGTAQDGGCYANLAPNSGSGGTGAVTGTTDSGDNVPSYVTVTIFKKD